MATDNSPQLGRPTIYSEQLVNGICERIVNGESLNKICMDEAMPNRDTLYSWLATKTDFSDKYARACKIRREFKFEALEDIIDKEQDVQRARLKADVIKWQLSKEEPKKYGDKVDVTSGGDKIERGMSLEEINAILARAEAEKQGNEQIS